MLLRILRSVIALATIIVVYQAYVLVAVPLLEPPVAARRSRVVTEQDRAAADKAVTKYQRLLANYFPRDHWSQQQPPIVLMSGPALLVVNSYEPTNDGRVDISKFALLLFPTPQEEGGSAPRDAIILESPEGAELRFDENFRLERGQIGQITGGTFRGTITIRSDMKEPGPHDDLLIETSGLTLNSKLLYTPKPVRFRMGENVGSGRELEIRLLDAQDPSSNKMGVASLEILREVRLRVDLKTDNLLPSELSPARSQAEPATADLRRGNEEPSPPVDLTCTGPFHFDFVRYVASFDQNVKIRQLDPTGPGFALDANQLDIHFAPRVPPGGALPQVTDPNRRQQAELGALAPALVVAQGEPVVVISPKLGAEARARRIQIHLDDRRVTLDGGHETALVYGPNVLKAPAIDYWHPAEDAASKIGRFRATGPGSLYYVIDEAKPDGKFRANWQTSVELGRANGQPVLALDGRPEVGVSGVGGLSSDQLRLTLRELQLPPKEGTTKPRLELVPDLLKAAGRVEIASPQLTARTEQLVTTFELLNQPPAGAAGPANPLPGQPPGLAGPLNPATARENPTTAYHIETDRLRLGLVLRGRDAAPKAAVCDGNVVFREIPLVQTDKQPLEMRGAQLAATGLDSDAARIKILGARAIGQETDAYTSATTGELQSPGLVQINGRGMTFLTAAVEIDQPENRLWSDGPGQARILITKDLEGRASERPYPIDLHWEEGMEFDGKRAVFRGDIRGEGPDDRLRCRRMIARLAAPIEFNSPKPGGPQSAADVAEIEFQGQVIIDHHSRDREGLASHDRMQLESLTINQQTGDVRGRGPGVIRSTRLDNPTSGLGALGGIGALGGRSGANPDSASAGESKLMYLRTDFDGDLSGNLHTRMISAHERVRTVVGPVDSWEQELDGSRADTLPPKSLTINCDELRANEDPMARRAAAGRDAPGGSQFGPIQLHAVGNVQIDARAETEARLRAKAAVATYDQFKETIVIRGEGRPAELWIQARPGEPTHPIYTESVTYPLDTRRPTFSGFTGGEFTMPVPPQNAARPATSRGPAPPAR
jgi:hypothetical protein